MIYLMNSIYLGTFQNFIIKENQKKTTYIGIILSILFVVIYIAFFIYKLVRMIKKLDIVFYETYSFIGTPSLSLGGQNFYDEF